MHFINEQDVLIGECVDNVIGPLLEVPTELGTGNHCADIQGQHLLAFQRFRYSAVYDTQRQTINDLGLTYTGLTNDDHVVFVLAGQNLGDLEDLQFTTDQLAETTVFSHSREVITVFFQTAFAVFLARAVKDLTHLAAEIFIGHFRHCVCGLLFQPDRNIVCVHVEHFFQQVRRNALGNTEQLNQQQLEGQATRLFLFIIYVDVGLHGHNVHVANESFYCESVTLAVSADDLRKQIRCQRSFQCLNEFRSIKAHLLEHFLSVVRNGNVTGHEGVGEVISSHKLVVIFVNQRLSGTEHTLDIQWHSSDGKMFCI